MHTHPDAFSTTQRPFNHFWTRRAPVGRVPFVVSILAVLAAFGGTGCSDDSDGGGGNGGNGADADCAALCDRSLDCPMDPDRQGCVNTCEALANACPDEARELVECTLSRPNSDYECDGAGETGLKEGICEEETNDLIACVTGSGGDTNETDSTSDDATTDNVTTDDATTDDETSDGDLTSEEDATSDDDVTTDDMSGPGEDPDDAARCQAACSGFETLDCGAPSTTCEADCMSAFASAAETDCAAEYVASIDCTLADIDNNFECGEDGEPVAKEGVCDAEQLELFGCLLGDQLEPGELEAATEVCGEYCSSETATPPIECTDATPCQATCLAAFAILGAECGQASLEHSACAAEADASEWTCDADGTPTYEGAGCSDEELAVLNCISTIDQ